MQCWDFWNEMFKQGNLPIDITLGCMIDALVEARDIKQALALFKSRKPKVMCDTIVYTTLIRPQRCRVGHGSRSQGNGAAASEQRTRFVGYFWVTKSWAIC